MPSDARRWVGMAEMGSEPWGARGRRPGERGGSLDSRSLAQGDLLHDLVQVPAIGDARHRPTRGENFPRPSPPSGVVEVGCLFSLICVVQGEGEDQQGGDPRPRRVMLKTLSETPERSA